MNGLELAEMTAHAEYRVCKDDHDPRGWVVQTSDTHALGSVSDLIIDEVALNARYLVCRITADQRRILIPTGFARLDHHDEIVHLDFITHEEVERLPSYHGLPLTAEQQLDVETALTGRDMIPVEPLIHRRNERRNE